MTRKAKAAAHGEIVLDHHALGRATLARQLLLARERMPVLQAVERVGPLQAQLPRPPFLALHARLLGFERQDLLGLLHDRKIVRGTLMRGTLHLVSARDYVRFRPVLQAALTKAARTMLEARSKGVDLEAIAAVAQPLFEEKPRSFEDVRENLLRRFPRGDHRAMGFAARMRLPLIQVPGGTSGEGRWGFPAIADFVSADEWLHARVPDSGPPEALLLRYLESFGPATVADAQGFLGLPGLSPVFERLRPRLATFRDEKGRELFDLPDAPRPPRDTKAPARFLPDFDSLILAHADRGRLVADEHRPALATRNLRIPPTVLLDGRVAGTWDVEAKRGTATLLVRSFAALTRKDRDDLTEEGEAILRFAEPEARAVAVRFARV